eukprot:COSAG03_NODE_70_length_14773_cov_16.054711_8_plen_74_part_00
MEGLETSAPVERGRAPGVLLQGKEMGGDDDGGVGRQVGPAGAITITVRRILVLRANPVGGVLLDRLWDVRSRS